MIRHIVRVGILAAALAGCGKVDKTGTTTLANAAPVATSTAQRPLLISPEDLLTVRSNALASGPSITGSVQPERRADLRAEVSAVVLQVLKENGDLVRRGERTYAIRCVARDQDGNDSTAVAAEVRVANRGR